MPFRDETCFTDYTCRFVILHCPKNALHTLVRRPSTILCSRFLSLHLSPFGFKLVPLAVVLPPQAPCMALWIVPLDRHCLPSQYWPTHPHLGPVAPLGGLCFLLASVPFATLDFSTCFSSRFSLRVLSFFSPSEHFGLMWPFFPHP